MRSEVHAAWSSKASHHVGVHARAVKAHHAWVISAHAHATHHHRVLLRRNRNQLHLLHLHVLGNLGVFVNLMGKQGGLELILREAVLDFDPVVGDAADKDGHHHGVSLHLAEIFLLEKVERIVVGVDHQLNCFIEGEGFGRCSRRLLHADAEVEELHRDVGVTHQLFLCSLEAFGRNAELLKHDGGA